MDGQDQDFEQRLALLLARDGRRLLRHHSRRAHVLRRLLLSFRLRLGSRLLRSSLGVGCGLLGSRGCGAAVASSVFLTVLSAAALLALVAAAAALLALVAAAVALLAALVAAAVAPFSALVAPAVALLATLVAAAVALLAALVAASVALLLLPSALLLLSLLLSVARRGLGFRLFCLVISRRCLLDGRDNSIAYINDSFNLYHVWT